MNHGNIDRVGHPAEQRTGGVMRKRFWFEIVVGGLGIVLLVVTLISREWIEIVFGIDPDGGSGALEMAISVALLGVASVSFVLARREFVRPRVSLAESTSH
jgi:hypothetical protein